MTNHITFPKPTKKDRKKKKPWEGDPLLEPYYPGIAKVSPELYAEVKKRSGGKCEICGKKAKTFIHHLIIGKLRKSWTGNLIDLCDECHNKDGSLKAIHHNSDVYEREMIKLQNRYFEMGYTSDQVRFLLGTKSGKLFDDEPRLDKRRDRAKTAK